MSELDSLDLLLGTSLLSNEKLDVEADTNVKLNVNVNEKECEAGRECK